MQTSRPGFSLVELSIVLVILGLLAGGILSGQALIRAAELRSVAADTQRFMGAIYTFRDKYFALPGDMSNASSFWGTVGGDCNLVSGTGTQTCDGNGDGQVLDSSNEPFRAWQHLANAGLVEGKYTGIATNYAVKPDSTTPGVNIPRGRVSTTGYYFSYFPPFVGDSATYPGNYGNLIWFGAVRTERPQGPVLKPEEAWNVDTKIDDGVPYSGKIIGRTEDHGFGDSQACFTSTAFTNTAGKITGKPDGAYNLSSSVITCALMIVIQ